MRVIALIVVVLFALPHAGVTETRFGPGDPNPDVPYGVGVKELGVAPVTAFTRRTTVQFTYQYTSQDLEP